MVGATGLPELVSGVALLNSAGQFSDGNVKSKQQSKETPPLKFVVKPLKEIFQRIVLGFLFWQSKQPARIESVLKSVGYLPCASTLVSLQYDRCSKTSLFDIDIHYHELNSPDIFMIITYRSE